MSIRRNKLTSVLAITCFMALGVVTLAPTSAHAKNNGQSQKAPTGQDKQNNQGAQTDTKKNGMNLSNDQASVLTATYCSAAKVTAGGSNYLACQGAFSGNDTGAGNPLLTRLNDGLFKDQVGSGTWTQLGKSDSGEFNANQGASTGNWSLLSGQKITGSFVLSLKAGNFYSAYLFKDVKDIFGGTFDTAGVSLAGNGLVGKGLSHASLFVMQPPSATPGTPSQAVPEPLTILGTVAAGICYGVRRGRKPSK